LVSPGPGGELVRGEPEQIHVLGMGAVIGTPSFDDAPGRGQVLEDVLVEAFVAQATVHPLTHARADQLVETVFPQVWRRCLTLTRP